MIVGDYLPWVYTRNRLLASFKKEMSLVGSGATVIIINSGSKSVSLTHSTGVAQESELAL